MSASLRWQEQRPEPSGLWLNWVPSHWPDPGCLWVDLSRAALGSLYPAVAEIDGFPDAAGEELHWIPPVSREMSESRDELTARVRGAGTPVLVQAFAGEPVPAEADLLLIDPLPWLVAAKRPPLEVPVDAWVLWPILAGLSDSPEFFDQTCRSLLAQGARGVLPFSLRLSAVERRLLARGRDEIYDALFHRVVPAERHFALRAQAVGLGSWLERPLAGAAKTRRRRAAAGVLAEIGELGARLGGAMSRSEAFFRAARDLEAADVDLEALHREGNLGVWAWRDTEVSRVLGEYLATGRSEQRERLLEQYLTASGVGAA